MEKTEKTAKTTGNKNVVESFIKAANYNDTRREGIGVTAAVWRGVRLVSVGKSWVKIDEAGEENLFAAGVIGLTPDGARKLSAELIAAADRAEALEAPPEPVKVSKKEATALGLKLLEMMQSGNAEAIKGLEQLLGVTAEKVPAKQPEPVKPTYVIPDEVKSLFDEKIAGNDEKVQMFEMLLEGNIEIKKAVHMVAQSTN